MDLTSKINVGWLLAALVPRVWFAVAAAIVLHSFAVHAQLANETPPGVLGTNLPLKSIGPGAFELGSVRFDKHKQEVTFPAVVNMDRDLIEYALVHSSGKVHESLLRTDAEPYHIHLAILLVQTNAQAAKGISGKAASKELLGVPVSVRVSWQSGSDEKSCRVEELILNSESNSAMVQGDWIYNGSRVVDRTFIAQRDGSVIAIISDPDALINNPRPGRENDQIWQVNRSNALPAGTPVKITIQLGKSGSK